MATTLNGTVRERGNGFPTIGELVDDRDSGTVYEIVGFGRPGGAIITNDSNPGADHTMAVRVVERDDIDFFAEDYSESDHDFTLGDAS